MCDSSGSESARTQRSSAGERRHRGSAPAGMTTGGGTMAELDADACLPERAGAGLVGLGCGAGSGFGCRCCLGAGLRDTTAGTGAGAGLFCASSDACSAATVVLWRHSGRMQMPTRSEVPSMR